MRLNRKPKRIIFFLARKDVIILIKEAVMAMENHEYSELPLVKSRSSARSANFELLRIFAMLLIIAHHLASHGGYGGGNDLPSYNRAIINIFEVGGKLGVNLFVLISGYFLITSEFRWKRLIKTLIPIFFYSIIFFTVFVCLNKAEFSKRALLNALFPTMSNQYWFMSAYALMYLLSPFINKALRACSKREHLLLLGVLIATQSVIHFIFNVQYLSNTAWFITLYTLAAYIRLYPVKALNRNAIMIPVFIVSLAVMAVTNVFTDEDLWVLTGCICLICSVSLFCTFKNFNMGSSRAIAAAASTAFGIYLIHDNIYCATTCGKSCSSANSTLTAITL